MKVSKKKLFVIIMLSVFLIAELFRSPAFAGSDMGRAVTEQEWLNSDAAYVVSLEVTDIADGVGPFDANDDRGNDSSANNRIIRSYDTIKYVLTYSIQTYDHEASYKKGYLCFDVDLPYTQEQAYFDTDVMNWMTTDDGYKWEVKENSDGTQRLTCAKKLLPTAGNATSIPGSGTVEMVLKVRGMKNGDKVKPVFSAYMDNNTVHAAGEVCTEHASYPNSGAEYITTEPEEVTVTTVPGYNIQLKAMNNEAAYATGSWDFSTGNEKAVNKSAGKLDGRLIGYGITVQLYNEDTNKGIKGIEYPKGPISFDLNLSSKYLQGNSTSISLEGKNEYIPLVWSYGPSDIAVESADGRDVSSTYGNTYLAAPFNSTGYTIENDGAMANTADSDKCWNGGKWTMTQEGNTIHCTISDYEINPNWFPVKDCASQVNNYGQQKNIGCFSAGELYVVVPYGQGEKYLTDVYGAGTIETDMKVSDLKATSQTGDDVTAQKYNLDDNVTRVVHLSVDGTYVNKVHYGYYNNNAIAWAEDINTISNGSSYRNGKDASAIGGKAAIIWGGVSKASGEEKNIVEAGDFLMKFDDEALTIDASKTPKANVTGNNRYYYAVKKDGTGWTSDDEMEDALIGDLEYYEFLSEAEENGVCVGILWSFRCDHSASNHNEMNNQNMTAKAWFNIRKDKSLTGKVYQTVVVSDIWRKSILSQYNVPDAFEVQNGATYVEKSLENVTSAYQKSQYDETGYTGGHTAAGNGWEFGDSLYLAGYEVRINKGILQKDSSGESKSIFNLDIGQNVVDYELKPYINLSEGIEWSGTTTMTITDVLPKGCEYIDGSSYLGAEYVEDSEGYDGRFVGGKQITPVKGTKTVNSEERNTLTWVIENVPVQYEQPSLYYKCMIAGNSSSGQSFVNTVTVSTTEDNREHTSQNGNMDTVGYNIIRLSNLSVTKRAEKLYYDTDNELSYNIIWSNNSDTSAKDKVLLDIMPANGKNLNVYSGNYTIGTLQINSGTSYEVYYTTDEDVYGTKASQYNYSDIKSGSSNGISWSKADVNDNKVNFTGASQPITSWAILGDIPAANKVQARISMVPQGNKPGDVYCNNALLDDVSVKSSIYIVKRKLSGKTWIDANQNGKREDTEEILQGVTVKLYDESGNIVKNLINGEDCVTKTDSNGNYKFEGLPEGKFKVVFSDGDVELGNYILTQSKADGADEQINSDAKNDNNEILIDGIEMPDAGKMRTDEYEVTNLDAGFYQLGTLKIVNKVYDRKPEDENDTYKVTINLDFPEGYDISVIKDINGNVYNVIDNKIHITFTSDDVVELTDLPIGTSYTVTSDDYPLYIETVTYNNTPQTITSSSNEVIVENQRIDRILSGMTWLDEDKDGIRQDSETILSGVTVTLYDETGNIAKDLKHNRECTAKTDETGKYYFDNLPDGVFKVVFSDGDVVLGDYELTVTNADDEQKTADSDAKVKDQETLIDELNMPHESVMTEYVYKLENLDAGFYKKDAGVPTVSPEPTPTSSPEPAPELTPTPEPTGSQQMSQPTLSAGQSVNPDNTNTVNNNANSNNNGEYNNDDDYYDDDYYDDDYDDDEDDYYDEDESDEDDYYDNEDSESDDEQNSSDVPRTGDDMNITAYVIMILVSLCGMIIGIVYLVRKRKYNIVNN